MWLSVRERIKEIGTMRAFGTQKEQILFIFLMEALFLGFIFVGGGAIFSTLLIGLLNSLAIPIHSDGIKMFLMTQTLHFSMSTGLFVKTVVVFSLVATLGAFFPAIRAARLRPVDALRQGK
jgi:putative ABC transport system permease protein